MVTPPSSVTSASPPVIYTHPHSPSLSTDMDPLEREEREKAVRKFLASAELSVVVRGLRARLSYASYKATHNIPHIPLNDLEAKTRAMSVAPPRLIGTKRKASGLNNYYNNPGTQGSQTRRSGNVPSPAVSVSSTTAPSRFHYYPTGTQSSSNSPQSLYTALLGPPPLKQARTVHNSADPPVQAPSRSTAGSRARSGHRGADSAPTVRSIAEGTRAQSRSRKEEASRAKGKGGRGRHKQSAEEAADVERKAVATLTSLLQSRPSIASASSPRSSLSAGSEGSFHSLSQYAQSSARTTTTPSSLLPSADSSFSIPTVARAATPPRANTETIYSTPRADDEEAANLMLYLHTSPSPVRATTTRGRDAKDLAAFRALGGGGGSLRAKGRVLFSGGDDGRSLLRSESSLTIDTLPGSQNSQIVSRPHRLDSANDSTLAPAAPMEPTVVPPTPVSASSPTLSQLLPAPLSPAGQTETLFPHPQASPTPGGVPFNLNDFINVSPSPAAATVPRSAISLKSGLGANLRTDLGRKLFEEEQHRQQHLAAPYNHGDGLRHEKNTHSLGASIDLSTR
ncbi:hypothetical protein J3R82DRAFT_11302 [Butyriboletus roseoflavus]|nr:hypothetical protein J3R82DRAFT_11302 [Butyriboletus roseoflavus]